MNVESTKYSIPWNIPRAYRTPFPLVASSRLCFCMETLLLIKKKVILLTAGEKGAAYAMGGTTGFVPCFENANIVETTGAGDAFSAGFIAKAIKFLAATNKPDGGLQQIVEGAEGGGEACREMVLFASAVGALTCGGDGAIMPQPTEKDVLRLLLLQEEKEEEHGQQQAQQEAA